MHQFATVSKKILAPTLRIRSARERSAGGIKRRLTSTLLGITTTALSCVVDSACTALCVGAR